MKGPPMNRPLSLEARDTLFTNARTHYGWEDKAIPNTLLQEIYNLAKMGPTSANICPARFIFVTSPFEKEKLKTALAPTNIDKTMTAPVTVIIAHDMEFYKHMDFLLPSNPDVRSWFEGNESLIETSAFRNGTLQGAYLMMAARACGLDCGPMSGFDADKVNELFFKGTSYKANFLCNMGYGNKTYPRSPRFSFEEVARIV